MRIKPGRRRRAGVGVMELKNRRLTGKVSLTADLGGDIPELCLSLQLTGYIFNPISFFRNAA